MVLCSSQGVDYAKLIRGAVNAQEYLLFFGMARLHNTPQGRPKFGNINHLVVDNAPIHRHFQ